MAASDSVNDLVGQHADRGRRFTADGVGGFALDEGSGPAVLLLHGVPASSWLYRKVVPGLAAQGLRAVAPDLPGLGLSARPVGADYTWSGLGRYARAAVRALDLDELHLVVHDIGGPVGFELAAALGDRVRSLTVLNTPVRVDAFTKPWPMRPYAVPVLDRLWLAASTGPAFRALMRRVGLLQPIPDIEIDVYEALLRIADGGRAFLKIMKGFETTTAKRELYERVVGGDGRPTQVVWGADDPALRIGREGAVARDLVPDGRFHAVPGRHFFPDDQAEALVARLVPFVETAA